MWKLNTFLLINIGLLLPAFFWNVSLLTSNSEQYQRKRHCCTDTCNIYVEARSLLVNRVRILVPMPTPLNFGSTWTAIITTINIHKCTKNIKVHGSECYCNVRVFARVHYVQI